MKMSSDEQEAARERRARLNLDKIGHDMVLSLFLNPPESDLG